MDAVEDCQPRLEVKGLHLAQHASKRRLSGDVLGIGVGLVKEGHDTLVRTACSDAGVGRLPHVRCKDVKHAGAVEGPDVTAMGRRGQNRASSWPR